MEIYVYKDECFDVDGGGATVIVYMSLKDAITAQNPISRLKGFDRYSAKRAWWEEDLEEPGVWRIKLELQDAIDGKTQFWQKDLTDSSIESITRTEFGKEV